MTRASAATGQLMRRDIGPLRVVDHDDERRLRGTEHGLHGGTEQLGTIGEGTATTQGRGWTAAASAAPASRSPAATCSHGQSEGDASPSTQRPHTTVTSSRPARAPPRRDRVLPTPGAPVTITAPPRPSCSESRWPRISRSWSTRPVNPSVSVTSRLGSIRRRRRPRRRSDEWRPSATGPARRCAVRASAARRPARARARYRAARRTRWKERSASACRPSRYCVSISNAHSASRSGYVCTAASRSATTSTEPPTTTSSMQSGLDGEGASLVEPHRRVADPSLVANSASNGPRHNASAASNCAIAASRVVVDHARRGRDQSRRSSRTSRSAGSTRSMYPGATLRRTVDWARGRATGFEDSAEHRHVRMNSAECPGGGSPAHRSSMMRSTDTTRFASRSSIASTARCFGRPELDRPVRPSDRERPEHAEPHDASSQVAPGPTRAVSSRRTRARAADLPLNLSSPSASSVNSSPSLIRPVVGTAGRNLG